MTRPRIASKLPRVAAALIVFILIAISYITRNNWLPIPFNPMYSENELLGKTKDEVRLALGNPYVIAANEDDNEGIFAYMGSMGGIAIVFGEDGKAESIRPISK